MNIVILCQEPDENRRGFPYLEYLEDEERAVGWTKKFPHDIVMVVDEEPVDTSWRAVKDKGYPKVTDAMVEAAWNVAHEAGIGSPYMARVRDHVTIESLKEADLEAERMNNGVMRRVLEAALRLL